MNYKNTVTYSVCMATYNGEKYVEEQLRSILCQLDQKSEVIIVDDCSKDKTVEIIQSFQDKRVVVLENEKNEGVNRSFEKAIQNATGKYIFMADQDDIWTENRFCIMRQLLDDFLLVSGNTISIDREGNRSSFQLGELKKEDSSKFKKNILKIFLGKAPYYGCAMAFNSEMKKILLPFPEKIESHDLYIAMAANIAKSNFHTEEVVLYRRIHGNNASIVNRKVISKLISRWILLKHYINLKRRFKKMKGEA